MIRFSSLLCLILLFAVNLNIHAQPIPDFQPIITSGLSSPVDIANAGDGTNRLFIVEKRGVIKILANNALLSTSFLDISSAVSSNGERGLLGLVFHPNYSSNGYFYVNYTNTSGTTTISRFSVSSSNANIADPNSELIILTISQPYSNHNAGDLNFGPDGYLYIAMGDGGSGNDPGNRSQNPQEMLGKMLRIDVNSGSPYSVPATNPFVGNAAILDEIWAIGLRNPWRFSFDRLTGDIWIADVGQVAREEIDFQPAASTGGENYGWRCYEGNQTGVPGNCGPASVYTFPIFEYGRSNTTGGRSVTGGYVYRGAKYPAMYGYYVFCDYASDNCWTITSNGSGGWTSQIHRGTGINSCSSFGEAENGELYAVSLGGNLYEVSDISSLPVELNTFEGKVEGTTHLLEWESLSEELLDNYEVQRSGDARQFAPIGKRKAVGNSLVPQSYQFTDSQPLIGDNYYRLKMADTDGTFRYSQIINLKQNPSPALRIQPNPSSGLLWLYFDEQPQQAMDITLYDWLGRTVFQQRGLKGVAKHQLDLSAEAKGLYLLEVRIGNKYYTEKLVLSY